LSQFFHLDNPVPDEAKMISIPIQKILNILPDWTPKSGLVHHCNRSGEGGFAVLPFKSF